MADKKGQKDSGVLKTIPSGQGLNSSAFQSDLGSSVTTPAKKRKHRAGKKKRTRRQSFIPPPESVATEDQEDEERPSLMDTSRSSAARMSFYRLKENANSSTSLDSDHLYDHRDHGYMRRRQSNASDMRTRPSMGPHRHSGHHQRSSGILSSASRTRVSVHYPEEEHDSELEGNDRSPLLGRRNSHNQNQHESPFYDHHARRSSQESRQRRISGDDFDVNNPPSVPTSPKMGALGDVMLNDDFALPHSPTGRDVLIDIDPPDDDGSVSPRDEGNQRRRKTLAAEDDVCFPGDQSELGDGEIQADDTDKRSARRRRRRRWPDLDVLDEWSREEKEERQTGHVRAKKITEPVMVGGRLRAAKQPWHREEDDAPYRYTYFNESFDATIHSRTISELCQFGASYKDLFNPVAPELSDSSSDEEEPESTGDARAPSILQNGSLRTRPSLAPSDPDGNTKALPSPANLGSPERVNSVPATPPQKPKRFGPRPTFWLDVLRPTEQEMKVLAKTFGIHQLTAEDIMMEEPREKVELFQNYYFVNYRSFEQDENSEDYMEAINVYVVVFRDGVLSFHFSMTPHPANVRRRIRQLGDYMSPSADWISYAMIDDVTDAFGPLVQQIEEEVDDIDDAILALHSKHENADGKPKKTGKAKDKEYTVHNKKSGDAHSILSEKGDKMTGDKGGDMLRHVGECRKKVMSLYRLLGNKADVIKGFAKRCNEYWEVAPRSEIGLYLGDIQDHIVTMTGNLSHYENLLSRAHSNYLAQINIRMSERAESTNDVLGKLTVLGTIVLPMNIVTGMWGMNVLVPGQNADSYLWFWCITAGLFVFGGMCFMIAKRVYRIV